LATVLLTTCFLAGCTTNKAQRQVEASAAAKATASTAPVALQAADAVIAEARRMPDLPSECRRIWHSGILKGDRLDVANIKADQALGGANNQIRWCAGWYDRTRTAREPK